MVGGTFQTAVDGTFVSATGGTFESDTGGTFSPLLSRLAIKEFSDTNARQRLELMNELGRFYRAYRNDIFHIFGNLNQSVKRANELAVAGLLSPSYISQVLMPEIQNTQKESQKALKLK